MYESLSIAARTLRDSRVIFRLGMKNRGVQDRLESFGNEDGVFFRSQGFVVNGRVCGTLAGREYADEAVSCGWILNRYPQILLSRQFCDRQSVKGPVVCCESLFSVCYFRISPFFPSCQQTISQLCAIRFVGYH